MLKPIEIIAHRGLWSTAKEQNSLDALIHAVQLGFGIETDIREYRQQLIISHDPPPAWPEGHTPLQVLFERIEEIDRDPKNYIALNIKCDGMQDMLAKLLDKHPAIKTFIFDATIPDLLQYKSLKTFSFMRMSDLEPPGSHLNLAHGIWLDSLFGHLIEPDHIGGVLENYNINHLAIVSDELHGRPHEGQWNLVRELQRLAPQNVKLYLCTDLPRKACDFFN